MPSRAVFKPGAGANPASTSMQCNPGESSEMGWHDLLGLDNPAQDDAETHVIDHRRIIIRSGAAGRDRSPRRFEAGNAGN